MKTMPESHFVNAKRCSPPAMGHDNRVPQGRGYSFYKMASNRFMKQESKGAALMIVLAFVVLLTGLSLAYFSRTTTDRQLAQSSFNDTTADLLARSALHITVRDRRQESVNNPTGIAA